MEHKRSRGINFSKEEEVLLVEEIVKYEDVIENKTINKISIAEKEEAWQKITNAFNAGNMVTRTVGQIRSKYDNLKTKARKLAGTGDVIMDPALEAVLNIINFKTVTEICNSYDSDSTITNNSLSCASVAESTNQEIKKSEDVDNSPQLIKIENVEDAPESDPLRNTILDEQPQIAFMKEKENDNQQSKINHKIEQQSNYQPKKFCSNCCTKRKPTRLNPLAEAKLEYYKKRKEYVETLIQNDISKNRREEEEHKKKMILYDLRIKLAKLNKEFD